MLEEVTASRKIIRSKSGKLPFRRILLEDATQFRMHPKNHGSFRAVANDSGATAGAKVDVVIDLISSGRLLRQKNEEGHVQDRTLGPTLLPMIRKRETLRQKGRSLIPLIDANEAMGLDVMVYNDSSKWIDKLGLTLICLDKESEEALVDTERNSKRGKENIQQLRDSNNVHKVKASNESRGSLPNERHAAGNFIGTGTSNTWNPST